MTRRIASADVIRVLYKRETATNAWVALMLARDLRDLGPATISQLVAHYSDRAAISTPRLLRALHVADRHGLIALDTGFAAVDPRWALFYCDGLPAALADVTAHGLPIGDDGEVLDDQVPRVVAAMERAA